MARCLPCLLPTTLPFQRLLLPNQELAPHIRLRSPLQHPAKLHSPGPGRRDPHVERADRPRQSGRHDLAAGLCGGGGPVERTEGRAGEESESGRGEPEVGADEGEDGVEGGEGWPGADGVLYAEWDAVCAVSGLD